MKVFGLEAKRVLDVIGAAAGLVVLAPLLLLVALLVWWRLGRPILFGQERSGVRGEAFTILKFRTMTDERDLRGDLVPDRDRLTPLGKILRATSIDELPELLNVLCGDMSLVGPRPLLAKYHELYSPEQARRLEVRPGITGWAQIHGRNALGWEGRFALDVWYVENQTLFLDLRILAETMVHVFARRGISAKGEATMTEFKGSARD